MFINIYTKYINLILLSFSSAFLIVIFYPPNNKLFPIYTTGFAGNGLYFAV